MEEAMIRSGKLSDARQIMDIAEESLGYQGQGIGSHLLDYAENFAQDQGAEFIKLSSSIQRTQAHHFYEKHGYTCLKEQKYFKKNLL